ncbi:DNA-binding response regulator [Roseateles noduli]|nr:DNA-binding response regulator [Roseateles noduli]
MNLLLVEDDGMLAEAIRDGMAGCGWSIAHASDASGARMALLDHTFAAVLLDIGLPGDSGLSVLRWMRERYDSTPVLILTARAQLSERIQGLDAGADDYLIKPFQLDELLARVRALTRRSQGRVVPTLVCGDVAVDIDRKIVTRSGANVVLSANEYRTLVALMERAGRVVTRDHLQRVVYGDDDAVESNTIAVFIHQLRKKLGEELIVTVHGLGYSVGRPRS